MIPAYVRVKPGTQAIDRFEGEYRFLSNFWPDNNCTLEHHYQAAKTDDPHEKVWILSAATPNTAKRLGRRVTLRPDWDDIKDDVMLLLLFRKFACDPLKQWLLATGHEELIERNWWGDTYWGVHNDKGLNKLGLMLMTVRDELRAT